MSSLSGSRYRSSGPVSFLDMNDTGYSRPSSSRYPSCTPKAKSDTSVSISNGLDRSAIVNIGSEAICRLTSSNASI